MIKSSIELGLISLLPSMIAGLFSFLNKKTKIGKMKGMTKQIVVGVVFGLLAVAGTEFGIPMNGAQINCRDAAVLTAGLFFGAPAGIIAGFIGGVERWIAVAWGVGTFTRVACSVSTVFAGWYAAFLRNFMFDRKKPGALLSLASGVVMEVIHLTMVFLTNMDESAKAISVVKSCSVPMIVANGIAVMISAIVVFLVSGGKIDYKKKKVRVSQIIQRGLLVTVLFAFAATTLFIVIFQDTISTNDANALLSLSLNEISADISDASDANLLRVAKSVKKEIGTKSLQEIVEEFGLTDANIIDKNGIITESSIPEFVGFDMKSGEQSMSFLGMLENADECVQEYGQITYDKSQFRKYAGVKTENGCIQIGYDGEALRRDIDNQVVGITKNRHVGETGYVIILDSQLNVISAPESFELKNLSRTESIIDMPDEDITFRMDVGGVDCFCSYRLSESYYIFSFLPAAEATQMKSISVFTNMYMQIIVYAALFASIYILIKNVVVNQIKKINRSLAKITEGDLDEVVNVRSNEEFESLSDDINSTVGTLKKYIAEASARIDEELEFAKNIQRSALPSNFSTVNARNEIEVFASMNPAKEVGGDFYDFYFTDKNKFHFLIADVSGKGIPAAMFMMRAKTELKSLTEASFPIGDVFTQGNADLCEGNEAGMFVTAWQGDIDLTTGHVNFANAGHNPPLIRRKGGKFEYLKSRAGFVLAGMEGVKYKPQEFTLEQGDEIYLYTDGVTEATNANKELYGEERLLNAINSQEFDTIEELCKFIKKDVDEFVGEAPQFDDITMLSLRYNGINSIRIDEATIDDVTTVTEFIESELEKIGCPMKTIIQINIAIDEMFSNIVKYGYPDAPGPVNVRFIGKEGSPSVYIRFEDEGIPYNPLTKEDPDITLSAEERNIGGLGIFMVKKTMDDIKYKYEEGKNILTIRKDL